MFRFTIRDLLWLMVVVGCLLGWWVDRAIKRVLIVPMFPHEMSTLCKPNEYIKVTVCRDGYDAETTDGSQRQSVRLQVQGKGW
jgi:hypothetical protein